MSKYLTIFRISWQNEFTYRFNFILWRVRNILRLLMTYFLWRGIFISNQNVFGYDASQMLTYVFMVLAVQSIVLSAPSADNIGGEIANGDLSNYLVRPISYLKYWFTRDLASKGLNLVFAIFEVTALWFLLRPTIQFPANGWVLVAFILSCVMATVINYFVSVTARLVAFWTPENTWGVAFVLVVFMETLAGGIFPLDILPQAIRFVLQLTPFPYMIYYPIAIFVGKVTGIQIVVVLLQAFIATVICYLLMKWLWKKGLKTYSAAGR